MMEIMELTIKEDFHCGTHYLFSFSYHKITFEKKYDIKLITLISIPCETSCEFGQVH